MKRGDVVWAEIASPTGAARRLPAVVVSHDAFNVRTTWRSVLVVPVSTSPRQARRGPTVVRIDGALAGLTEPSVAVCHQVTTLDRSKLSAPLGSLPGGTMAEIDTALRAALDLSA
jgi:mRNA-degrading endonuclease toxin of MazEF toxin-antitoxin module